MEDRDPPSSTLNLLLLEYLRPRCQYGAQKVVDVGLTRIEIDDGHTAL